jgi:hypothetical protein
MGKLVACGSFVKRQTKESGHSHYSGSWEDLEKVVTECMRNNDHIRPGYKDGVVLVDLGFTGFEHLGEFYSAIVDLNENTKLTANYAPRRDGEAPFIRLSAKAKKQLAKYVTFVCYRADVLEVDGERETDADWEIVAIKARVTEEEEPMHYYTMARNFLHLKGGTQGSFSAEEFANSIIYWNEHVMCSGKPAWLQKLYKFLAAVFS